MLNVGLLRAVIFMVIGGISIALMQAAVKLISFGITPFIITLYRAGLVFVVLCQFYFGGAGLYSIHPLLGFKFYAAVGG